MKEIWKDVVGYENKYQVSNLGNVKSLVFSKPKLLNQYSDKNGYLITRLWNKNKPKHCKVHRLVAEAFIPNTDNKPTVNHKDLNKSNNHVSNLEWMTRKEQSEHAVINNAWG